MSLATRYKRKLITSAPVKTIIRRSKATYVPGSRGFSLYEVVPKFFRQLRRTSLVERAAAISFNVFMAIPPTLIFVFTLIPYLPIEDAFIQELYGLIRDIVPGEKDNSVIISFLEDFLEQPRNELLSFGLFLAMIFSSNAMMGVLRSFDRNYHGFHRRSGLKKRQTAMKMTFAVLSLVFLCVLLLIAQGAVLTWLGISNIYLNGLITNLRWVIIVLVVFYLVSLIYRHGPPLAQKWPFVTAGSVFATALMVLATLLVTFWVNNFSNYNKLYGSISAVFILMLLIYINSLAVLMGFELNVTLENLKRKKRLEAQQATSENDE